jgi:hypothetical protein
MRSNFIFLAFLFCSTATFAQNKYPNYDPSTVETIKGKIVSIDSIHYGKRSVGIHVVVRTDVETITVHLGPDWYLNEQGFEIEIGEEIEVTGSRVTIQNMPSIIAAEIRTDDETLPLRDPQGIPFWSGKKK